MNLKSFINNKYTLVGSIVFYLTGVYLTSRFATYLPCEGSPRNLVSECRKMAFLPPIEPFGQQHSHSIRGYSAVAYQQPFLSYSETHIASIPIFSVVGSLFPVPFALMQRKHNGCGSNDDFVFFFLGLSARKGTTGISNDGNHLPMYPVLSRICLLHTPVHHRIRANKVFHAEIPVRSIYRIRHPVLDIDRNRNHAFLRIVCIDSRFYVSYTRNTPL